MAGQVGGSMSRINSTAGENSDVLLPGPVAVTVMNCPGGTAGNVASKDTVPPARGLKLGGMTTVMEPTKRLPSPLPEGSHEGLE